MNQAGPKANVQVRGQLTFCVTGYVGNSFYAMFSFDSHTVLNLGTSQLILTP